jgi:hypothetical protein
MQCSPFYGPVVYPQEGGVVIPGEGSDTAKDAETAATGKAPSPYPGSWLTCVVYLPSGPIPAPSTGGTTY